MNIKKIFTWIAIIILITFMSWSISKLTDQLPSLDDFWALLTTGVYGWVGYSLAFFLANFLRSQRWRFMLGEHVKLSMFQSWLNFQWLFMVKSILPFMSGEVVRALWLKTRGGSGSYGVGVFLFEKISDLIVLFFGGLLVVYYFFDEKWNANHTVVFILVVLFVLLLAFFAEYFTFILSFLINICEKYPFTEKLFCNRIEIFQKSIIDELPPWKRVTVLLITWCIWSLLALGMWTALFSLNLLSHWTESIGLLVSVNFAGFISPLPANLGTYQFAGSGILLQYGVLLKDAVASTIVLQIVMLLQVTLVGLASLIFINLSQDHSEVN